MPAYILLTRGTLIALYLAMHPGYESYASKKQIIIYHMCLHLYVSVCILHISCMYVYVCVCIYVPEASQAGRRARRQGKVGRRAARAHPSPSRQAAGWAPAVTGLHVPPALQNCCHPSLNLSPGLPVWQPHGSCFEPCRLHAGHGRTSHSR